VNDSPVAEVTKDISSDHLTRVMRGTSYQTSALQGTKL